jgi:signal transduction histidine kinase
MSSNPATSPDIIFFGKMVAGATHELNNIIAVINELRGLLGDMFEDSPTDIKQLSEKAAKITDRIENQAQRGSNIIRQLNKFAHLADQTTSYDLCDVLRNLIEMTTRFAKLKKIKLELIPHAEPIILPGNPLSFARAISEIIFLAMESDPQPEILSIAVRTSGMQVVISIAGLKADGENRIRFALNDAITSVGEIGAKVELITNDNFGTTIIITLMRNIN